MPVLHGMAAVVTTTTFLVGSARSDAGRTAEGLPIIASSVSDKNSAVPHIASGDPPSSSSAASSATCRPCSEAPTPADAAEFASDDLRL